MPLVLDQEVVDRLHARLHRRVVVAVADRAQRHHAVQHRRLDAAPAAVPVLAIEDPLLGARQRAPAKRLPRAAADQLQHAVELQEEISPGEDAVAGREREVGAARRAEPKLLDAAARVESDPRPVREQQQHRHHGLARPARHRVDVQREPRRQQDRLDRHRRQPRPRELSEVREVGAREHLRAREPAVRVDVLSGTHQRRLLRAVAGELQREVCLDRGAEVSGAALVQRPAAVARLLGQDVLDQAALDRLRTTAHEAVEHDVLRVHADVGLERCVPVAARELLSEDRVTGVPDRITEQAAEVGRRLPIGSSHPHSAHPAGPPAGFERPDRSL